ncbi:BTAD domain-containing putative transcriptional regulator [Streptomyces sp. NPDC048612]|uniref:AfsR/SARP family transcriptional regulator n=1 Tax=Streptomyces sp. NPDC048612 TaxID=3365579 RepID=UPI00371257CE
MNNGRLLSLGTGRLRSVAAILISEVNQVITVSRMIDLAWDADPPARARGVVHNHVHRLRRLLVGQAEIATRGQGYALLADPCAVDVNRFRYLVSGAYEDEPRTAVAKLRQALGLWRGEALADVPGERVRRMLGVGLTQARVAALQELGSRLLMLGRYGELITELTAWLAEHPLHEELTALLMRALQASGRQAEALDHYHRTRRHLEEHLGIDPGPALSATYLAVLSGKPMATPPFATHARAGSGVGVGHGAGAGTGSGSRTGAGVRSGPGAAAPYAPDPAAPGDHPGPGPTTSYAPTAPHAPAAPYAPTAPYPQAASHGPDRPSAPLPHPPRPTQLPPRIADFCGRAREIVALDQTLDRLPRPDCVVLAGGGGAGKTTLAVHWAHRHQAEFPDGQLFADLRGFERPPMRPDTVLGMFLRALGVPEAQIPDGLAERSALYRALLAGRRMLVLLDNAGTAEQARPLLPATPGCLAVVTSRRRLSGLVVRDGAALVTVGPFAADDALQLLGNALGPARLAADPAAARELVERCDRLPLALRIAAARLMAHPDWPLGCWTGKLADERRRLQELSAHDADLAVEACLYLSYRALSSGAARLFRLLGLHPGPDVDLPAAAALAGRDAERTHRHLAELSDAHLVEEHAQGHYVRTELVRLYAAQRVASEETPADRDLARERLRDHMALYGR